MCFAGQRIVCDIWSGIRFVDAENIGVLKGGILVGNDMRRDFFENFDGTGDKHLFF